MTAYYNEVDPFAAAWLRELIKQNLIAPGDVDERSIEDVTPADLLGYTQCHFFAGIGVWSYALRLAGWPDDRPVWTGSCPCQPFSAAGKGEGFADERHLWPAFFHLIEVCGPERVFGEQVAGKDGLGWLDLVSTDLEAVGYACGAVPFPAAGIGAPHIRERLYWVADRDDTGLEGWRQPGCERAAEWPSGARGLVGGLADDDGHGRFAASLDRRNDPERHSEPRRQFVGMADMPAIRWEWCGASRQGRDGPSHDGAIERPGPVNGFWGSSDWLGCRDDRWRPVEPGPQPLADGSSVSLGRVCDQSLAQIEEEIDAWSVESQSERAPSVRALQLHLGAQTQRRWAPGGVPGLHEAPFLLAFMRQLTEQGWSIPEGIALSCEEAAARRVRLLRDGQEIAGSPCQRGLVGQSAGEPANALHLLSSLLARHAHQAWGDAHEAYAEIGQPLGTNLPARVMRLRGYGNAIVAPQAQAFIESYIEVRAT